MICKVYIKFKFQSPQINSCCNTTMFTCFYVVYVSFMLHAKVEWLRQTTWPAALNAFPR